MHRMKYRVNQALQQYPVAWWTRRLATYLWKFAIRVKTSLPECWIAQSCEWEPNLIEDAFCEFSPYRDVGRPRLKWDDVLNRFCRIHFNVGWKSVPVASFYNRMQDFVNFYNRDLGVPIVIPIVSPHVGVRALVRPVVPFFVPSNDNWW